MPARQISGEVLHSPLSLPRLLELKSRWKVSIWVLLRRASDLCAINERQYITLANEMYRLGYHITEPDELAPEVPGEVAMAINLRTERGQNIADLARKTYLTLSEFIDLYLGPSRQLPHR